MDILNKYRKELIPLRRRVLQADQKESKFQKEIGNWRSRYQQKQNEIRQLREELDQLRKKNRKLEEEVERLTKTKKRYQIYLFDHGNFINPASQEKKTKGGQPGHSDTNREAQEDAQTYPRKRVYSYQCLRCGHVLGQSNSTKEKTLIDIVINPELVKLILEQERQWCRFCKKEVITRDAASLPFTEYGINVFLMILILRYRCWLSLSRISVVLEVAFGLKLTKSVINSLLHQSKQYLTGRYEELTEVIRKGEMRYNDETGWLVRGKSAWLWIMANEDVTVYKAAESRGKGIIKEMYGNSQANSMHDGYGAYAKTIPKDRQMYCWAHILRFVHEETNG